jgi:hypothetical protein
MGDRIESPVPLLRQHARADREKADERDAKQGYRTRRNARELSHAPLLFVKRSTILLSL